MNTETEWESDLSKANVKISNLTNALAAATARAEKAEARLDGTMPAMAKETWDALQARAEKAEKIIQGEMQDPNGCIWEAHSAALRRAEQAESALSEEKERANDLSQRYGNSRLCLDQMNKRADAAESRATLAENFRTKREEEAEERARKAEEFKAQHDKNGTVCFVDQKERLSGAVSIVSALTSEVERLKEQVKAAGLVIKTANAYDEFDCPHYAEDRCRCGLIQASLAKKWNLAMINYEKLSQGAAGEVGR